MAVRNLFTGKAGERAVVSQFLIRECQVAVPEVDVGDDLFVAQPQDDFIPVQVKTARARQQARNYCGLFRLSLAQVSAPRTPQLLYVFAVHHDGDWSDFVLMRQRDLHEEHRLHGVGTTHGDHLTLRITFDSATVQCSRRDWTIYRSNWSVLSWDRTTPLIRH